jgi:hypothetical protein
MLCRMYKSADVSGVVAVSNTDIGISNINYHSTDSQAYDIIVFLPINCGKSEATTMPILFFACLLLFF